MEIEPKENSDLLTGRSKVESNGIVRHEDGTEPPDGGLRAYAVLVGSFLINGLLFGVINCYGVIHAELAQTLKEQGVSNSESSASLPGSLAMGVTFAMSPVAGALSRAAGLRATAIAGGTIAAVGLVISSFVPYQTAALCASYGVLYGLGAALAYTPSLAILAHYYKRRLGLANGLVALGSSVFTVLMLPLMKATLDRFGLAGLFRALAALTAAVALSGAMFAPVGPRAPRRKFTAALKDALDTSVWRNARYRAWALAMAVALVGYFVPYVHLERYIEKRFGKTYLHAPLQCLAAGSGVGRIVFGALADRRWIDRIGIQQTAFYVIGALTIALPFAGSTGTLAAVAFFMGLCDGAFVTLIGPVAVEVCGAEGAAAAIGGMLGLAAAPLCAGPPLAGALLSIQNDYTIPFIAAGVWPLFGASLMFLERTYRKKSPQTEALPSDEQTPL